jgi:predicted phosphodiesterase
LSEQTKAGLPYTVEHKGGVVIVRVCVTSPQNDWEQWFLLRSDAHHDSAKCQRDLERQHLDEAVKKNAGVIDAGDVFDAMQGRQDKRGGKAQIRPEYLTGDYFDVIVRDAADFYEPYAHHFILFGQGNHESSVREKNEIDLVSRLVGALNDRTGAHISTSGYTGWVQFKFQRHKERTSRNFWYTHGYGGDSPVTQGMTNAYRERTYIENADVMMSGHSHNSFVFDAVRLRLNSAGVVERRVLWYVHTPTYQDDYGDGRGGWAIRKGMAPKPLGAYWLRFHWDKRGLQTQVIRAT